MAVKDCEMAECICDESLTAVLGDGFTYSVVVGDSEVSVSPADSVTDTCSYLGVEVSSDEDVDDR